MLQLLDTTQIFLESNIIQIDQHLLVFPTKVSRISISIPHLRYIEKKKKLRENFVNNTIFTLPTLEISRKKKGESSLLYMHVQKINFTFVVGNHQVATQDSLIRIHIHLHRLSMPINLPFYHQRRVVSDKSLFPCSLIWVNILELNSQEHKVDSHDVHQLIPLRSWQS